MKYLRQIDLHLDRGSYSEEECQSFLFAARSCCNYVERRLRPLRCRSPYSRLIILCTRDARSAAVSPLEHEPYLEAIVKFDAAPVASLSFEAVHRQVARAILCGLKAANPFTPMPVAECTHILQEFAAGGFLNRWVVREKSWSRQNCRCVIAAEMTIQRFTLDQIVYLDDEPVATRRIAETKPREGLYEHYFGELAIDAKKRIQYRRGRRVLTRFDLRTRTFVELPPKRKRAVNLKK